MKKKSLLKGIFIAAMLMAANVFVCSAPIQVEASITAVSQEDLAQAKKAESTADVVHILKKARAEHEEEILIYTNPSKVQIENEMQDCLDLHSSIYNYFHYGYVGGLFNAMDYDVFSGPSLEYIVCESGTGTRWEKFLPDPANPGYGYYKIVFVYHDNEEELERADQKIRGILSNVSGRSQKEQVFYVYEYLKKNLPQEKLSDDGYPRNCNGIYGALFGDGTGYCCSTYACTIQRFMELADIPSYILGGAYMKDEMNHAFNMVEIDKKWYIIDYTADLLLAGTEEYKNNSWGSLVRKYMAGYPLGQKTLKNSSQETQEPEIAPVEKLYVKQTAYNKLTLSWDKVSGVTGYQIYRSTKANSGYKKVASLRKTSQTLTAVTGTNYYYKVRAYLTTDGKTYYGKFSPAVKKKVILSAPSITYGKSETKAQAALKWKKVSGASGYEVSIAQDKKFTKSKKTVDTKALICTFKELKSKAAQYVKIRAYRVINGKKIYSAYSTTRKILIK